jgi:hypothetical protein
MHGTNLLRASELRSTFDSAFGVPIPVRKNAGGIGLPDPSMQVPDPQGVVPSESLPKENRVVIARPSG